jgi:hypothetical protein
MTRLLAAGAATGDTARFGFVAAPAVGWAVTAALVVAKVVG